MPDIPLSEQTEGPRDQTIPVDELPPPSSQSKEEKKLFDYNDKKKLDLEIRKLATRGSLVLIVVLYVAGLISIWCFLRQRAPSCGYVSPDWHIVVAVLIALFSVPTVVLIALLRSTNGKDSDGDIKSLHEMIGDKMIGLLEKAISK